MRLATGLRAAPVLIILAALLAASCRGDDTNDNAAEASDIPQASEPALAIARLAAPDLPPGFRTISFYHDIPGLLREMDDPMLAEIGVRAAEPGHSDGQGFANPESGELLFVITVVLKSSGAALDAVAYLREFPTERIAEFVSPDEALFEDRRQPDPTVGNGAVRFFLRYGSAENDGRTRNVASDLLIFANRTNLTFVLRSFNSAETAGTSPAGADLVALSHILVEKLADQSTGLQTAGRGDG